jgi:hypothetical protein
LASLTLQAVLDAAPGSFFDPEVVTAAFGERAGE